MKNTVIDNIFFDFNGTILDDLQLSYDILVESCLDAKIKVPTIGEYKEVFMFPVKKYYEKVGFDFTVYPFEKIAKTFNDEYWKRWKKETFLFPNLIETLNKLKKEGYKLYILTASEINLLLSQLNYFNITDYFDELIASKNNLAFGKIDYGKEYIKLNKIDTSKSILFGDTVHDFEVAKELNLKCLLFSKGHNSKEVLSKYADVVDSYDEFYDYIKRLNKHGKEKKS